MATKFISPVCYACKSPKVTLDSYYGLPNCFSYILVCPKHPDKVSFDISVQDMMELVSSAEELEYG